MYKLINERAEDIVLAFTDPKEGGSVNKYTWLCSELSNINVATSEEYQKLFRGFWRMRCGEEYRSAYFKVLERNKKVTMIDPIWITRELYEYPTRDGKKTIEFSIATKLAHMVNNHKPIYDSMVRSFFFISEPHTGDIEERLKRYDRIYKYLEAEYKRILENKLLAPAIEYFKNNLEKASSHTDEKIIDWLIWKFVDLSGKKAWFINGQCKYY